MRYTFMRRLDRWLGTPLCLLLGMVDSLLGRTRRTGRAEVRRILVIKFLGMGSMCQALAMLKLLRQQHPHARVSMLTFDSCVELAGLLGVFDEVRSVRSGSFTRFAWDSLTALFWAWAKGFDSSYNLEFFSLYSQLMSRLINARTTTGFFVPALGRFQLLTHPVPFNPNRHISLSFLAQLTPDPDLLGHAVPAMPTLPNEARNRAQDLLRKARLKGPLIAINANASNLSSLRLWPLHYYAKLMTLLHERSGASFILTGGPGDKERVAELAGLLPHRVRCLNLAAKTSVAELMAVLGAVRLVISNDSGPLHLAALMGKPTVSFWGAESARIYGPLGDRHLKLDLELHCSPCLNARNFKDFDCPYGLRCLRDISPEQAFKTAALALGSTEPATA
ncbi:MAG: glycosyltransferase family 9 protein [Elusimicrobiota bacterium]|jgi:ADP-heptose:LPS heptosyltransferase